MDLGIAPDLLFDKVKNDRRICFSEDNSMICFWKPGEEIQIYRRSAGYLINTLGTREENSKLMDVKWIQKTLFCCYSNGTVTVFNEGRELQKQYSLLPKGARMECVLCDQLQLARNLYSLSDGEILKSMPKINKWDVIKNDLSKELITSEESGKQKTVNVFLAIENKTNKLIISIEGILNVRLGDKVKVPKGIDRILRIGPAKYMLLNQLSEYQIIDLSAWTEHSNNKLIKAVQEYSTLLRNLKQLHRHLGMKLADPYYLMAQKLFTGEQRKALSDMFYFGTSDKELRSELRDSALDKFRLGSLRNLSNDLCGTSAMLMVSSMSPLLERLVVLGANIESLCESLTWLKFREQKFEGRIRSTAVELLKDMNVRITTIAQIEKSHRVGFVWLQTLHDRLSMDSAVKDEEDHKFSYEYGFCTDTNDNLLLRQELEELEKFLCTYIIPESYHRWVKQAFPNKILELQTSFDTVMKDYILKWFKKQINLVNDGPVKIPTFTEDKLVDVKAISFADEALLLLLTSQDVVLLNLEKNRVEASASIPKSFVGLTHSETMHTLLNSSPTQLVLITNLDIISNHSRKNSTKPSHLGSSAFCILPSCVFLHIVTIPPHDPSTSSPSSRDLNNPLAYEIQFFT